MKKIIIFLSAFTIFTICFFHIPFIEGKSLYQNAVSAPSSSILPRAKGGTESSTASNAAASILGSNFGSYSDVLPLANGGFGTEIGTSAGKIAAQKNLGIWTSYTYGMKANQSYWYKIGSVKYNTAGNGIAHQISLVTGISEWGTRMGSYLLEVSGRRLQQEIISLTGLYCAKSAFYIDLKDESGTAYQRDIYIQTQTYANKTTVIFLTNSTQNPAFTPDEKTAIPEGAVTFNSKCPMFVSP